ncbi:hypothetical protein ACORG1_33780 (plasmid) [Mycobacterium sp. TJFP1]
MTAGREKIAHRIDTPNQTSAITGALLNGGAGKGWIWLKIDKLIATMTTKGAMI